MNDTEFSKILSNSLPINVIKQINDTTILGQKYVIVVNKILWYKIRVFLKEDHLDKRQQLTEYHWSQHLTEEGVEDHIKWIKARLNRTPLLFFEQIDHLRQNLNYYISKIKIDDGCKINPEKYFNAGDHLSFTRKDGIFDCIYIGNKKVVHIISEKEASSKRCAKAKEVSWEKYVGIDDNGNVPYHGTVYVVVQRLRIRKPKEIVEGAKELSSKVYPKDRYNFSWKNSQHFATYCCIGKELPYGVMQIFANTNIRQEPGPFQILSELSSPLLID